ncbi:MAG TPA: DUF1761 domain-containing protein [Candidatus Paceibacterota bacterium]|nr:DUF1761 domain-containing protein [Candidatus Paceibacterota bacterium]
MEPVNIAAVIAAAAASFVIGMLWYGPLFGKVWMKMMGFTAESMKAMKLSPVTAMVIGAITTLLTAYVLAHGIVFGNIATGMFGVGGGLTGAFWYWLGFAVPLSAGAFLWEGKSFKLWAFNAAYYLVSFLVMGAILGAWA